MALNVDVDLRLRRYEMLLVSACLAVVTGFSLFYAQHRAFWMDEYLTYDTDLQGSASAVWKVQTTLPLSVDPPLYHFLLQYWLRIVSPSEFGARLLSVLAYTVMCFLLYQFTRRYTDIYASLTTVVLALGCGAFRYAHEARPYALVLSATAIALTCWTNIVDERKHRWAALLGLWAGIVIACGSHWFGCLIVIPFIVGELVRTWQTRKFDRGVWLVLATGPATMFFYLPLLRAAAVYRAHPWMGVHPWDAFGTFALVLEPCLPPLVFVMVFIAVVHFLSGSPRPETRMTSMPAPVFTCVVSFALIPFAGIVFGKLFTHVFLARYVLFCTVGLLVLVSETLYSRIRLQARWRAAAFLTLATCIVLLRLHDSRLMLNKADRDMSGIADLTVFSEQPSLPIVLSNEDLFLRIEAHGSPQLRQRCLTLIDANATEVGGDNTLTISMEGLRMWTPNPIEEMSSFLAAHPSFYLINYREDPNGWMIQRLKKENADIALQGTFADDVVFLVTLHH